jgi:hypothetical protein
MSSDSAGQMMDRKELLRKEYNRMIETRLPNIYTMMSHFNEHKAGKYKSSHTQDIVNDTNASIVSSLEPK